MEIPADGDYWLLSAARGCDPLPALIGWRSASTSRTSFLVGGRPSVPLCFRQGRRLADRGIVLVTGDLTSAHAFRFYHLVDLPAHQTVYAYAEALTGDLKPVLTLLDYSDKPLAYGNFAATEPRAALKYQLPQKARGYRHLISSQAPGGKATAGNFRLLIGLDAPEVLRGEGESTGRELLREPIPVDIGLELQQITGVDQKAENFGVVGTLVMHWRDLALAFDPET